MIQKYKQGHIPILKKKINKADNNKLNKQSREREADVHL
jgi:hypothetical protein